MQLNPLFRLLLLINYYLTSFYQRSYRDAHWHAALVTPLLLFLNVLEVRLVLDACSDRPTPGSLFGETVLSVKEQASLTTTPLLLLLMVVNYWLVYRRQKYQTYFFRLSCEPTAIRYRDLSVFWGYFLLTVAPCGWWLMQKLASMP